MKQKPKFILFVSAIKCYRGKRFYCTKRLPDGVDRINERRYSKALVEAMDDVLEEIDVQEMLDRDTNILGSEKKP